MRYLVIASCVNAVTGARFKPGDEFLPEPDEKRAAKLIEARCIEPMPAGAPDLPLDDLDGKTIAELTKIGEAEGTDLAGAKKLDDIKVAIRAARLDLEKLDHDQLLARAATEQVEIADGADDETIRAAIKAKNEAEAAS
tara:strand:- start:204 stop:620 length:417 start_codon:yes stop_codon:yes gene_type:complete